MTTNLLVVEMMFLVSKTSQHSGKIHVDSEKKKKQFFTIMLKENLLVKLEHFWLFAGCTSTVVASL